MIPFAESFIANCEFKKATWAYFEPAYFCYLRGIEAKTTNTIVAEVHGTHLAGRSNDDVNSVWIEHSPECLHFPKGFEKFFLNIRGLSVTSSGLKSINQDDLRVFPELTAIWVYSNKLTTVEPKLFAFNPKMKIIDFGNNRIRSISADLLDPFEKLIVALFNQNICTVTDAKTSADLKSFEKEILEKCQHDFQPEQRICHCNDQQSLEKIALLETNFALLHKELGRLKASIEGLTTFSK